MPFPAQHLNEEQLKLLETKPLLEVALAEHERVRIAMEGVAKEVEREAAEQAKLAPPPPPPPPTMPGLSIPPADASETEQPPPAKASLSIPADDPGVSTTVEEKENAQQGSDDSLPHEQQLDAEVEVAAVEVSVSSESVGVSTDPVTTEEAEAQTDVSGPPPPPGLDPRTVSEAVAVAATLASQEKDSAVQEAEERGVVKGRAAAAAGLSKVLRLLHVASRFEAKGERLPTAVDFFSKVCGVVDGYLEVGGAVQRHTAFRLTQFDPMTVDRYHAVAPSRSSFHAESPAPQTLLL